MLSSVWKYIIILIILKIIFLPSVVHNPRAKNYAKH